MQYCIAIIGTLRIHHRWFVVSFLIDENELKRGYQVRSGAANIFRILSDPKPSQKGT